MRAINEVVDQLGLDWEAIEPYGRDKVKVPLDAIAHGGASGKLVVVTAITPTPAGEGKTTTSIGLTDGLARIGKRAVLAIREPSLGPLFGMKGGGTGGGRATVEPAADINLHFTGDFHAIQSTHNFLASMADNAVRSGGIDGFAAGGITWRRVTDAEDRALRRIVTGVGGRADGPLRDTGFDISAASEIMAIVALASDYDDLRLRLSEIVVGWTDDDRPVRAGELDCVGAMMVLLKDALKPNLVQTAEGQPAIVHTGPFGNIAHGCSSILADRLALATGEIAITEAGFGADLGFEKFMDIKVRQGGPEPSAAVVVATVRGLRWHGGAPRDALDEPDAKAVEEGSANLRNAIGVVRDYGLPAVVAINRFPTDTAEEIAIARRVALEAGALAAIEAKGYGEGGAGMTELADAVVSAVEQPSKVRLLYEDDAGVIGKVETLAREIYHADAVSWDRSPARRAAASSGTAGTFRSAWRRRTSRCRRSRTGAGCRADTPSRLRRCGWRRARGKSSRSRGRSSRCRACPRSRTRSASTSARTERCEAWSERPGYPLRSAIGADRRIRTRRRRCRGCAAPTPG